MKKFDATQSAILMGLVLPTTLMLGSKFFGSGPASAKASDSSSAGIVPFEFSLPQPIANTEDAQETITAVQSPFWFEVMSMPDLVDPYAGEDLPMPEPTMPEELVELTLTSILPSVKNPMAVIDGKPCRIGDNLPGGWKLVGINGDDFTVTVVHKSGKKTKVRLKKTPG